MKKILLFLCVLALLLIGVVLISNDTQTQEIDETQTNIKAIKQELPKNDMMTAKGYVIYKTTSCIFRVTDPPYPPGTICGPDSGYFVISDIREGDILKPTRQKTTLNEKQLLISGVPDSVIGTLTVGELYNIQGTRQLYSDTLSLKFSSLVQ